MPASPQLVAPVKRPAYLSAPIVPNMMFSISWAEKPAPEPAMVHMAMPLAFSFSAMAKYSSHVAGALSAPASAISFLLNHSTFERWMFTGTE